MTDNKKELKLKIQHILDNNISGIADELVDLFSALMDAQMKEQKSKEQASKESQASGINEADKALEIELQGISKELRAQSRRSIYFENSGE